MKSTKFIRALTCFSLCATAQATVFTVSNFSDSLSPSPSDGSFRSAILSANDTSTGTPHQIIFSSGSGTIGLLAPLPPIGPNVSVINTSLSTITLSPGGASPVSGLVVSPRPSSGANSLSVTGSMTGIHCFLFSGLTSVGGNGGVGGGGGGGALGAGGGLLVGQNCQVAIQGVAFSSCGATGGNGAANYSLQGGVGGGGGGGMSGGLTIATGGAAGLSNSSGGGGGGGFGFAKGGTSGNANNSGGGGGGGVNFNGGSGASVSNGGGGGGGSDGANGASVTGTTGGNGANDFLGNAGGSGGTIGNNGTSGAASTSAGGGGGGGHAIGGNATLLGGFGGGTSVSPVGGGGGAGVGGGGGGGGNGAGGSGGFGGGGGGASGVFGTTGGTSVFGGGGGGGGDYSSTSAVGGDGGFGGGGGGGGKTSAGGFNGGGGTTGNTGGGGGGAALGGQIFVDQNAHLILQDLVSISGGSVAPGTGGGASGISGSALGLDIFLRSSGTLEFQHSGTLALANSIASDQSSSTVGGLTVNGTGTLDISATANIYTGTTTIKGGGTIVAAADSNLGSTSPNLVPILLDNGTLEMSTAFNTSRSITMNSGGGIISVISSTSTINSVVSGAGALTKAGDGTLILSGANTYTGDTIVSGGILEFPGFGTYPNVAGISLTSSSAQLVFNYSAGAGVIATDLSGVSGSSLNLGTLMLTFGTANSTTFAGNITSTGNVIKQNSGTVIFSGTNNYSSTTISSGTLQINSTSAIPASNNINDNSNLAFGYSGTLAISGQISGSGMLTMLGPGTLILSNASNTYNGPTTIEGGILQPASGGAFPSGSDLNVTGGTFDISAASSNITAGNVAGTGGAITLGSNTLIFGTSNSTSFGGNITGTTGGLTKQGGGTFTLGSTSSSSYSGNTHITAGTFTVDGTIANSPILVDANGTLKGTGTVGNVTLNGTIAPGNSIGTINTGSFTFNPGSSYPLEFNNTSSDLIASTGTVTINSGSALVLSPIGLSSPKSSYTIITASSVSAAGTFTLVNPTTFHFSVEYGPSTVTLVLGGGGGTGSFTATGNAGAAAACFNVLAASPPTSLSPVIAILNLQTPSEWQQSFNEMQPANFNDIALAQENVAERIRQIYSSHLYDQRVSACDDSPHWRVWATPFAEWAHQDGHGSLSGYNENFAGFTVALDYMTRRHWAVSTGFSFAGSEVDIGSRSNSHFKTYAGSFATMWTDSRWFADALFAYLYSPIQAQRKMSFSASAPGFSSTVNLTASHRQASNQVMAHLGWGYNILCYSPHKHRFYRNNNRSSKHRVNTFPFANLDYIYVMQNGYTETGADALDLSVRSKNYDLLRPEAGLGFNYIYCHEGLQCNLDLTASYVCEIRFAGQSTTANFAGQDCTFTVRGLKPFNNLFSPTARVTIGSSDKRVFFSLGYHGEYGANFSESAVEAELKRSF